MSTTVRAESGTGTAAIVVQQQSGAIGALITGVNLAEGADEATFELLHRALLDHGVICIRGQAAMTLGRPVGVRRPLGRGIDPSLRALHRGLPGIDAHL